MVGRGASYMMLLEVEDIDMWIDRAANFFVVSFFVSFIYAVSLVTYNSFIVVLVLLLVS